MNNYDIHAWKRLNQFNVDMEIINYKNLAFKSSY